MKKSQPIWLVMVVGILLALAYNCYLTVAQRENLTCYVVKLKNGVPTMVQAYCWTNDQDLMEPKEFPSRTPSTSVPTYVWPTVPYVTWTPTATQEEYPIPVTATSLPYP